MKTTEIAAKIEEYSKRRDSLHKSCKDLEAKLNDARTEVIEGGATTQEARNAQLDYTTAKEAAQGLDKKIQELQQLLIDTERQEAQEAALKECRSMAKEATRLKADEEKAIKEAVKAFCESVGKAIEARKSRLSLTRSFMDALQAVDADAGLFKADGPKYAEQASWESDAQGLRDVIEKGGGSINAVLDPALIESYGLPYRNQFQDARSINSLDGVGELIEEAVQVNTNARRRTNGINGMKSPASFL